MSAPRQVLPGISYFITRRVAERRFRLRPSELVNAIVLYCFAYAAQKTGVDVHAFTMMSNHYHSKLTDVLGRQPEFEHQFHRLTARALNKLLERRGAFWSPEKTTRVRIDEAARCLESLAYTVANPVTAGLVESPEEWPGLITLELGKTLVAKRPDGFFSKNMPEEIELRLTVPPSLQAMSLQDATARLEELVREKVERARKSLREQGRSFLGVAGVLSTPVDAAPTNPEPQYQRKPTFAAFDREAREAARAAERAFRQAHGVALGRYCAGDHAVRFPEGTYMMRVRFKVSCGPPELHS